MKKMLSRNIQIVSGILFFIFLHGMTFLFAADNGAAIRSIERAASLLASAQWKEASFEARLGSSYDPTLADFAYIEALSLVAQNSPRFDILERVENSLASGLFWRTYSRNDALLLCARMYAETCRYSESLFCLKTIQKSSSADADYVRILALYGLGRFDEARTLLSSTLESWPFDSRFPRIFLQREVHCPSTHASRKIAELILSRLYLWENTDRELLLLAVPFEKDPSIRDRNIRIYRSMGKKDSILTYTPAPDPLSAMLALEYGIIDEGAAIEELFFAEKTGIRLSLLTQLCHLVATPDQRKNIESRIDGFNGIIIDDANNDGIFDTRILYRLGRPIESDFDRNQDGYADYTISCDLGVPTKISLVKGVTTVIYDTYPFVRSVTVGNREYTMKPLSLSWAPVKWKKHDFNMTSADFFTFEFPGKESELTERLLISSSSFYTAKATDRPAGEVRVTLEKGVPVSSESRDNGHVYSWTSYKKGYQALTSSDRDGDGYFETSMMYDTQGNLASVTVDRNGNRKVEYREEYSPNGDVLQKWDSDENGVYEISYRVSSSGVERIEWLHPDTQIPVIITVEGSQPRSVRYGSVLLPVLKDPIDTVWWIKRVPLKSREIVTQLNEKFNREASSVVSCSITVDGKRIHAVRTGGMIFAELVDD